MEVPSGRILTGVVPKSLYLVLEQAVLLILLCDLMLVAAAVGVACKFNRNNPIVDVHPTIFLINL